LTNFVLESSLGFFSIYIIFGNGTITEQKTCFIITPQTCILCCFILGSGVFAQSNIEKGQLIVLYEGELVTNEEGERRHAKYSTQDGSFLFFFSHKGNKLWYVIQIV